MKILRVLLVVVSMLFIFGCKAGPRVVDNQYQVMGYPAFSVDKEFVYLGSPKMKDDSVCVSNCRTFDLSNGTVMGDLFVREEGGKIREVAIIQRDRLDNGYYWTAVKGPKVRFGEKEYVERFFSVSDKEDGGAYLFYAEQLGKEFASDVFVVRKLERNVSDTNKLKIYYSCASEMLPESVRESVEDTRAFLRDRFAEVVTLPQ